jgi:ferric-dicitrate binding protein FerR (iron transport regulator)
MIPDDQEREIEQVVRYLAGECTSSEADAVRGRLANDAAFEARMRPYVVAWTVEPARRAVSAGDAWRGVQAAIAESAPVARVSRRGYRSALVAAGRVATLVAATCVVGGVYLAVGPAWVRGHVAGWWDSGPWSEAVDRVAPHGRGMSVTIPDGTRVEVGGESWIRYSRREEARRGVYLEGVATFAAQSVANTIFMVRTPLASFGTAEAAFTVDTRRPGRTVLSVVQGTVTVWPAGPRATPSSMVAAGESADVWADSVSVHAGR